MIQTMLMGREAVSELVPHKGKMLLLHRISAYDIEKRSLASEYDITPDCIFFDSALNGVPSWVGFEFMAQSISALSGICGKMNDEAPRPGVILSVSNLKIDIPVLESGTTAVIQVLEDCKVDAIYTFHCILSQNGKQAVSAKLMVMETGDISQLGSLQHAS
ncbi:MAG: 3-hydroxylacyl-ACP dehydratase [Treponema sp.]|jgi:predicted hotdog family 3-hydroxylacyl-ACP dehydratase|nr:3-hydroxylacyl-ACP dehydratase [Treponema sp.]